MASTYSNLKFELIGTGDQSGTWGTTTNTNLGTAIEQALVGMATISSGFTGSPLTLSLTLTDTNAAQNARALCLNLTQSLASAGTLNVPAIEKPYMIINATGQTVTVKVSGLTGVAVPTGTRTFLYNNGTDVGDFVNYLSSLTLGTDLAVADGGTGSSTAAGARTNLGATTAGGNLFTLTNPSAITFLRINADNTVSALSAADFRTAIGAGTGGGSVTQVDTSGSVNGITLTGGPITSSGTVTLGGTLSNVSLTSQVTGTLPVGNGGTGATTLTANNVILGNGTSAVQFVAPGSNGNVLQSNGTTWTSAAGVSLATPLAVVGNATAGAEIRLPEDTDNGTNYVALKAPNSLSADFTCTLPATTATLGYLNLPAVGTKTASYTLAVGDVGKYVQVGSGGSITIPDATFAEGDVVIIANNTSGNITITCTITTAYIAGTDADKATVTLATRGLANIVFLSSTVCIISGNVS